MPALQREKGDSGWRVGGFTQEAVFKIQTCLLTGNADSECFLLGIFHLNNINFISVQSNTYLWYEIRKIHKSTHTKRDLKHITPTQDSTVSILAYFQPFSPLRVGTWTLCSFYKKGMPTAQSFVTCSFSVSLLLIDLGNVFYAVSFASGLKGFDRRSLVKNKGRRKHTSPQSLYLALPDTEAWAGHSLLLSLRLFFHL